MAAFKVQTLDSNGVVISHTCWDKDTAEERAESVWNRINAVGNPGELTEVRVLDPSGEIHIQFEF